MHAHLNSLRTVFKRLLLTALLSAGMLAHAGEAPPAHSRPELDAQVQAISLKLRCLVCQNQSVAESDAELAQDLRQQVRMQLEAGQTEAQILDFMVTRYGDFVLYQPALKTRTWVLWGAPGILALGGLFGLGLRLRRRARESRVSLNEDERTRARALLDASAQTKEKS